MTRPAFLSRSVSGTCVARGSSAPIMRRDENDFELGFPMERVTGIEPASRAWEALILPLNYTRRALSLARARTSRGTRSVWGAG
jgi:hypothetical protein